LRGNRPIVSLTCDPSAIWTHHSVVWPRTLTFYQRFRSSFPSLRSLRPSISAGRTSSSYSCYCCRPSTTGEEDITCNYASSIYPSLSPSIRCRKDRGSNTTRGDISSERTQTCSNATTQTCAVPRTFLCNNQRLLRFSN
jgi:hypothetical protein